MLRLVALTIMTMLSLIVLTFSINDKLYNHTLTSTYLVDISELIITAGGENIAPISIEDKVKEALPCVSNCMLIGDKKKFLSMLVTLKVSDT